MTLRPPPVRDPGDDDGDQSDGESAAQKAHRGKDAAMRQDDRRLDQQRKGVVDDVGPVGLWHHVRAVHDGDQPEHHGEKDLQDMRNVAEPHRQVGDRDRGREGEGDQRQEGQRQQRDDGIRRMEDQRRQDQKNDIGDDEGDELREHVGQDEQGGETSELCSTSRRLISDCEAVVRPLLMKPQGMAPATR